MYLFLKLSLYSYSLQFFNILRAVFISGWCVEVFSNFFNKRRIWKDNYSLFSIFFSTCCGIFILVLVLGFVPEHLDFEVRKPLKHFVLVAPEEKITRPLTSNISHVRGKYLHDNVLSNMNASNSISREKFFQHYENTLSLQTIGKSFSYSQCVDEAITELVSAAKVAFIPSNALGEPLNFYGIPLRWSQAQNKSELNLQSIVQRNGSLNNWVKITDSTKSLFARAFKYRSIIEKYARRYNLSPELVYAIICAESSCNPTQISHRSAHGLMQIVPKTAGFEVNKWFGLVGLPSSDALLHPETNIKYGTSYLYLLMTRHLNAVKNSVSREYCAIAAYNMGIGAMLRTFAETPQDAIIIINRYSAKQIHEHFMHHLPIRETRIFLQRVLSFKENFTVLL